jgi:DNA-binding cell septation regulator SpoVG
MQTTTNANHQPVRNVVISPAPPDKSSILAVAQVELGFDEHTVTIEDVRVLRNRQGELWVSLPTRSVRALSSSREYQYLPVVTLSRLLKRQVEDAVLAEYQVRGASNGGAR